MPSATEEEAGASEDESETLSLRISCWVHFAVILFFPAFSQGNFGIPKLEIWIPQTCIWFFQFEANKNPKKNQPLRGVASDEGSWPLRRCDLADEFLGVCVWFVWFIWFFWKKGFRFETNCRYSMISKGLCLTPFDSGHWKIRVISRESMRSETFATQQKCAAVLVRWWFSLMFYFKFQGDGSFTFSRILKLTRGINISIHLGEHGKPQICSTFCLDLWRSLAIFLCLAVQQNYSSYILMDPKFEPMTIEIVLKSYPCFKGSCFPHWHENPVFKDKHYCRISWYFTRFVELFCSMFLGFRSWRNPVV